MEPKNKIKNEETDPTGAAPDENYVRKSSRTKKGYSWRDDSLEKMMARKTERARKVKKPSAGKEITIAFLIVAAVVLTGTAAAWLMDRKPAGQKNMASENISVLEPIIPAESVASSEEKLPEEKAPVPVAVAELDIKILNAGASAGLAGKVKLALVSQGYEKAEAGNAAGEDISGNFIYYSTDEFEAHSQKIKEFLATRRIEAEVAQAKTEGQKGGHIVILLGK